MTEKKAKKMKADDKRTVCQVALYTSWCLAFIGKTVCVSYIGASELGHKSYC